MMIIEQSNSPKVELKDSTEISLNGPQEKVVPSTKEGGENTNNVSFCSEVIMIETLHHKNYSETEKKNCWNSKEDLAKMRKEYTSTLKWMKENECRQDNSFEQEHCFRGLEFRILDRAIQRKHIRTEAWMAVFQEQAAQIHQGVRNDDVIAARYFLISRPCAFEAYNIGLADEIEAFRDDDALKCRTSQEYEGLKTQITQPRIQPRNKRKRMRHALSRVFRHQNECIAGGHDECQ